MNVVDIFCAILQVLICFQAGVRSWRRWTKRRVLFYGDKWRYVTWEIVNSKSQSWRESERHAIFSAHKANSFSQFTNGQKNAANRWQVTIPWIGFQEYIWDLRSLQEHSSGSWMLLSENIFNLLSLLSKCYILEQLNVKQMILEYASLSCADFIFVRYVWDEGHCRSSLIQCGLYKIYSEMCAAVSLSLRNFCHFHKYLFD